MSSPVSPHFFASLRSSRGILFAFAALGVVGISVAAYTGHIPSTFSSHGVDKVLHATMTFILTSLLTRALVSVKRRKPAAWLSAKAHVIALLAGVLVMIPVGIDEYAQRFSHSRSSDWMDLLADVIGVTLAIALASYRYRGVR